MKKILTILLFILIFFIGSALRFYQLGSVPNSLDWDEVSWGYNAYAILQTGKDEYGFAYPLSFKAFGDYKQPVYVYSEILPIKIFGLNAFSVRFPSAFFGSLSSVFVFLFVYELFRKQRQRKALALLSMSAFAISPWSIQFSRVAFESTVGLFFVLIGVWTFLLALRVRTIWYLLISAVFFALSAYTYHSEKLFTPFFVLGLVIYAKDYFLHHKKLFFIFGLFFIFCNLFWLIDSRTTARGASVLFTSQQTALLQRPLQESAIDIQLHQKIFTVFHNRRFVYANTFAANYLSHFNINWLFIQGDLARHHAPNFGLLYLISLPFILIGFFWLFMINRPAAYLLGFWLLLAPISGALVTGAPNAERALIMLPIWQIGEAWGIVAVYILLRKRILTMGVLALLCMLYLANILLYVHNYFIHTNTDYDRYWQYGYAQAVTYTKQHTAKNQKIYFADSIEQGYIFYLFYAPVQPKEYLATSGSNRMKNSCYSINNAYFGKCEKMLTTGDLYVTSLEKSSEHYQIRKKILYAQGDTAVYIYQLQ